MRHITAAFAVEAKLVLDDLVGEAEEERIAVGLVVVRVPAGHHEHVARSMETFNVMRMRKGVDGHKQVTNQPSRTIPIQH